ncbi:hypothetical protein F0Q32_23485 [Pseudocitrobacter sp. 73]|nr:hypothetical protein F0Q32_23485 [Pseudocitrobacter sp. 73]
MRFCAYYVFLDKQKPHARKARERQNQSYLSLETLTLASQHFFARGGLWSLHLSFHPPAKNSA